MLVLPDFIRPKNMLNPFLLNCSYPSAEQKQSIRMDENESYVSYVNFFLSEVNNRQIITAIEAKGSALLDNTDQEPRTP